LLIGEYDGTRTATQDVQKGRCITLPTPARRDVPFPVVTAASDEAKRIYFTRPPRACDKLFSHGGTLSL
jgi:hypothetical protein